MIGSLRLNKEIRCGIGDHLLKPDPERSEPLLRQMMLLVMAKVSMVLFQPAIVGTERVDFVEALAALFCVALF